MSEIEKFRNQAYAQWLQIRRDKSGYLLNSSPTISPNLNISMAKSNCFWLHLDVNKTYSLSPCS